MTRDRDPQEPRVRITDKRRFADAGASDEEVGAGSFVGPVPTQPPAPDPHPTDATAAPDIDGGLHGDPTDELGAVRAEAAQYLDHLRRLQAEFDNYRKRVLKEQTHAIELAAQPIARRLLEVLDDFELALMAANDKPAFDRFLHGVELVYAKLADALKTEGLEKIQAEGKPFDPELHEALMQTGEGDELVVADVLRPGYTLKGRVLRPAGVRVERR